MPRALRQDAFDFSPLFEADDALRYCHHTSTDREIDGMSLYVATAAMATPDRCLRHDSRAHAASLLCLSAN